MTVSLAIVIASFIAAGLWGLYCGSRGRFGDVLVGGVVLVLVMLLALAVL